MRLETSSEISTVLIHPLFSIGCLVHSSNDRHLIGWGLARIGREHGKANAMLAKGLLEELWSDADIERRRVRQGDVDRLTSKSYTINITVLKHHTDLKQPKRDGICRYGDKLRRARQAGCRPSSAFDDKMREIGKFLGFWC
jgi:hypothetical protein